jgi:EAL domain-containing protein (putative c-di-GMP-specific phosphodiesterase class I)
VGINVSPRTLLDPQFEKLLGARAGRHVVLELTDIGRQPEWPVLRSYLEQARDLGARIAVNAVRWDMPNQQVRLVETAPDIVKLDVTYTSTLVDNRGQVGVAEELLLNCIRGGMFVVGVGVEEAWQLDVLRDLGVDAAQGYLIGRPQPISSFQAPELATGDDDRSTTS